MQIVAYRWTAEAGSTANTIGMWTKTSTTARATRCTTLRLADSIRADGNSPHFCTQSSLHILTPRHKYEDTHRNTAASINNLTPRAELIASSSISTTVYCLILLQRLASLVPAFSIGTSLYRTFPIFPTGWHPHLGYAVKEGKENQKNTSKTKTTKTLIFVEHINNNLFKQRFVIISPHLYAQ